MVDTCHVTGIVISPDGDPVPRATVRFQRLPHEVFVEDDSTGIPREVRAEADADGNIAVDLIPGEYKVLIIARGYNQYPAFNVGVPDQPSAVLADIQDAVPPPSLDDAERAVRDAREARDESREAKDAAESARDQAQDAKAAAETARDDAQDLVAAYPEPADVATVTEVESNIGKVAVASDIAGTGAAYTASTDYPADEEGSLLLFTPHEDNSAANPTLAINGGPARAIRGISSSAANTPAGRLVAGVQVLLRREGALWRIVSDFDGSAAANVAVLFPVTGDGTQYEATARVPLLNNSTVLMFMPPADNEGAGITMSINGGDPIPIRTENGQALAAGQLLFGGRYLAQYSANAIRVIGVKVPNPAQQSKFITLANVAGDGAAYTASAENWSDVEGAAAVFIPNVDQAALNPTLSINGGTARAVHGPYQNASPSGWLKAGAPVLLYRAGAAYKAVADWDGLNAANVALLTSMGGTPSAYTATARAPLVSGGTLVAFTAPVDNAGGPQTISINGGDPIRLYTEDSANPIAGQLKIGSRYIGLYSTGGIRVYGLKSVDLAKQKDLTDQRVHHETVTEALWLSTHTNPLQGAANERDPIYVQGGNGYSHWVASVADAEGHLLVTGGSPRYVDLRMIRDGIGSPVMIYVSAGTTKIIADKIYTAPSGAIIKAWQPVPGSWVFDTAGGDLTEESDANDPAPACDITLMTAGQSHAVLLLDGSGTHGIQRGLREHADWKPSIWPIQGAWGSTGLVPFAGANYWWNPDTDEPGPALLNWKAQLDAKPANQPMPSAIIWGFGQNDATKIGDDPTMTPANYKATHEKVFAWMRAQTGESTPIIWLPLQAYDNDVSPSNAKVSAIRWTMFDIAASDPNVHIGPIYHDLWHPYGDQHPPKGAQIIMGYRLAATLARILQGANVNEGPAVTGIVEEAGGASYRLTLAGAPGNPVHWPYVPPAELVLDGIEVYASGAHPLFSSPVEIERFERASQGLLRIHLKTPTPNATIMWPAGAIKTHRAGRHLRSINSVPINTGWANHPPLQPFRSGAF